jgi:hypothetical protein
MASYHFSGRGTCETLWKQGISWNTQRCTGHVIYGTIGLHKVGQTAGFRDGLLDDDTQGVQTYQKQLEEGSKRNWKPMEDGNSKHRYCVMRFFIAPPSIETLKNSG